MSEKRLHNPETMKSKEVKPAKTVDPKVAKAVGQVAVKNANKK